MPRIRAHFTIKSPSIDVDQITSIVGLPPTDGRPLTDRKEDAPAWSTRSFARWRLSTNEEEEKPDRDLATHVAGLLDAVEPLAARWVGRSELRDAVVMVSCVAYMPDSRMPALLFSSALLARVSRLGAALDVDLYPMWTGQEEKTAS